MSKFKLVLRRPFKVNPVKLQSLVKHSDCSVFRIRTTTPKSLLILTKDTINHHLWNPTGSRVDDQEGRLAQFNKKFNMSSSENINDILSQMATGEGRNVLEKKQVKQVAPVVVKKKK